MGSEKQLPPFLIVWIDVFVYACTIAGIAMIAAITVGIATGGGFVRSKVLLFVIGWVLLAYATVRLWPTSPADLDTDDTADVKPLPADANSTRIQRIARELPPARWIRQPTPEERFSQAGKLFWASCAVLLASFLMETVFGVV